MGKQTRAQYLTPFIFTIVLFRQGAQDKHARLKLLYRISKILILLLSESLSLARQREASTIPSR